MIFVCDHAEILSAGAEESTFMDSNMLRAGLGILLGPSVCLIQTMQAQTTPILKARLDVMEQLLTGLSR
jgi:hypothetical protein